MTPRRTSRKPINKKPPPPKPAALAIGMQLARLRNDRGLSQAELAELIGVHRNSVYRFERGEPIPFDLFLEICEATHVPASVFVGTIVRVIHSLEKDPEGSHD